MSRGTNEKRTYLSVMQGKIIERLGKTDKRAKDIETEIAEKNYPGCNRIREIFKDEHFDKTVFERVDDYIDGIIVKISVESGDFGDKLLVLMDDYNEVFQVQMQADGSSARCFMQIIPNVDPLKPVKIRPWKSKNKSEGLAISQGGDDLSFFWGKDDPKDHPVPPAFSSTVPYDNWDASQKRAYKVYQLTRLGFLQDYMLSKVAPNFMEVQGLPPSESGGGKGIDTPIRDAAIAKAHEHDLEDTSGDDQPLDDLPF